MERLQALFNKNYKHNTKERMQVKGLINSLFVYQEEVQKITSDDFFLETLKKEIEEYIIYFE
jgi:hypothetical protein